MKPRTCTASEAQALVIDAIRASPGRMTMLAALASLRLSDSWIAAGAIRSAVWDRLHGFAMSTPIADVDVIWFDPQQLSPEVDREAERQLEVAAPGLRWSVKNQARMHLRNGDAPYASSVDAMCFWPETATAIAGRLSAGGAIELAAPFGLDDLLGLVVRPTPHWRGDKLPAYRDRITAKQWQARWPRLTILAAG